MAFVFTLALRVGVIPRLALVLAYALLGSGAACVLAAIVVELTVPHHDRLTDVLAVTLFVVELVSLALLVAFINVVLLASRLGRLVVLAIALVVAEPAVSL